MIRSDTNVDNSNLRKDQQKAVLEALMAAAAARRHAELGQAAEARNMIEMVIERLAELAKSS